MTHFITDLSTSLGRHCLSYLEGQDIRAAGAVCKKARTLASDNLVWKNCIEQTVTGAPLTERMVENHGSNYKALYRQLIEKSHFSRGSVSDVGIPRTFCLHDSRLYVARPTKDEVDCVDKIDGITQKRLGSYKLPYKLVSALAADARYIFAGFHTGQLTRTDQSSNALTVLKEDDRAITQLADDETALYATYGIRLAKWDKESGTLLFEKELRENPNCFDIDRERIYVCTLRRTMDVFAKSGDLLATVNGLPGPIRTMAVDETRIYLGPHRDSYSHRVEHTLTVWDKENLKPLSAFAIPGDKEYHDSIGKICVAGEHVCLDTYSMLQCRHISIRNRRSWKIAATICLKNNNTSKMCFDARTQTLWGLETGLHGYFFAATHEEVWQRIKCEFLFDFCGSASTPMAFSSLVTDIRRMPKPEQEAVFKHLYEIMKPWPAGSDTWQCAERAVVEWQNSPRRPTLQQMADAISAFEFSQLYERHPWMKRIGKS